MQLCATTSVLTFCREKEQSGLFSGDLVAKDLCSWCVHLFAKTKGRSCAALVRSFFHLLVCVFEQFFLQKLPFLNKD